MHPQVHPHGKQGYHDLVRDQELERWIGALRDTDQAYPEPTVSEVR